MNSVNAVPSFRLVIGSETAVVQSDGPSVDAPTIFNNGSDSDVAGVSALISGDVVKFDNPNDINRIFWSDDTLYMNGSFVIDGEILQGIFFQGMTLCVRNL